MLNRQQPAIAVHGGAGTISRLRMTPAVEKEYHDALAKALAAGFRILEQKGSAADAVVEAVMELENFPLFNAGRGSVFTNRGTHEMDAALMNGKDLSAGAVAGVKNIKNPILLAKKILLDSPHVLLFGDGAEEFAKQQAIPFESSEYFYTELRHNQLKKALQENSIALDHEDDKKFGTVGAVAVDEEGNVAAATSTGGMTNKQYGRVGDSPVVGAGTYANNKTCAVSCTGHGEYFMRHVAAYDVSCLMEYKNYTLEQAAAFVIGEKLKNAGGQGGLIAVDAAGNLSLVFNTQGMYRGWKKGNQIYTAIF